MAKLLNFDTNEVEDVPDTDVTAIVSRGSHGLPLGDVRVVAPDGSTGVVPAEKAPEAFQKGFRFETAHEATERKYGDSEGKAFAAGAGRGITFGLSDLALSKTGLVDASTLEGLKEANPGASIAGEVAGTAASLLIPGGGAVGAAGKLGRLAGRGVTRALGEGLAGRLVGKAAGAALEGGLFGMGSAVSEAALGDTELTAEKLLAGAGVGALIGGGLGAVGGLAGEGVSVGRKALNQLATEKVAGAEARALAMGEESAAELTGSLRGKYGAQAAKASNLLETGNQLLGDVAVSPSTKSRLAEALSSVEAQELREVTARNVVEDFEGQAASTLGAKAAFREAADSQSARAVAKAEQLLSPTEAIAQVKARAARYGAPAIGRIVGGTLGTLVGGLPGTAVGALAGDMAGSLAGGQLRPSLLAVKRMFEHPAVVKAFFGAIKKATAETPEVFGKYASVLANSAARSSSELAVTHIALSEQDPEYRDMMATAGFPLQPPDEAGAAAGRAGELSRVQAAVAAHDTRMNEVVDGFLRGQRVGTSTPTRDARESKASFEKRAAELAQLATNPQALAERFALSPQMQAAAPGVSAALAATAARAVSFLHEVAPKSPHAPNMKALAVPWQPSDAELSAWEKRVRAVERPATVLEDLQRGTATKEAVEALKAVYPKLHEDLRQRVLERMANLETRLPFQQRRALTAVFGPEFDGPSPAAAAVLQQAHRAAMQKEMAKGRASQASGSGAGNSLATQSQRLEGRGGVS